MFQGWEMVEPDQVLLNLYYLKELFSNSNTWISWPLAINTYGNSVSPLANEAVKWCLLGASEKFTSENYVFPLSSFVDCATREYLNELSQDFLIKGNLSYQEEFNLICLGISNLEL